ncbi:M23 family metallopeptidase [Paenibacillus cremeus]|uniref:M23 family metallopeptidase n=1 Tax=Paenibacillus cremeus TaxID=2163881 RepID=A0A559K525_9BACL|nr:M23 family metallopeptidase [Paenibacillus cremeus]TVY07193.1 M23 family metallopeptidase [Paenibacillus cremeus]
MRIELVPRMTADHYPTDLSNPTPHTGVDIAVPIGSPVYAPKPKDSIVARIADYVDSSLCKALFFNTRSGYQYNFGYLSDNSVVREGERVHIGDLIGYSDSTNRSTEANLHLGLFDKTGTFVDPSQTTGNDHLGILGRVLERAYNDAHQSVQEHVRSIAYDTVMGFIKGIGDLVFDLSYAIALLGGGLAIILYVAGWRDGARWAGMLTVGYSIIKYLAAGA